MGVNIIPITPGHGAIPTKGQTVTIEYTGWVKDTSKPDNKGEQYVKNQACPGASSPAEYSKLTFPRQV